MTALREMFEDKEAFEQGKDEAALIATKVFSETETERLEYVISIGGKRYLMRRCGNRWRLEAEKPQKAE